MLAVLKEEPTVIKITPKKKTYSGKTYSQMAAKTVDEQLFYKNIADKQVSAGMDNFPAEVYGQLLEHTLNNGKFRDAMFLVCMANWGMRYGDLARVRFGHIFDKNGNLKRSFSLPDGEQKTGKRNVYYNNEATAMIIDLYLRNNLCSPYDYMFTSKSHNAPKKTLTEIEAEELYSHKLKALEKHITEYEKQRKNLLKLYTNGAINDAEFAEMNGEIRTNKAKDEAEYEALTEKMNSYVSSNVLADMTYIQQGMTKTAAENIIKDNLAEIGIFCRNRKDRKSTEMTLDKKLNTHSLRKTFSVNFVDTGAKMNRNGELNVDETVVGLLQHKLRHSNVTTTGHYDKSEERAFEEICTDMNIGLEIIKAYIDSLDE